MPKPTRKRKSTRKRGGSWLRVLRNLTRNCKSLTNTRKRTECYIDQGKNPQLFTADPSESKRKHMDDMYLYDYYNPIATKLENQLKKVESDADVPTKWNVLQQALATYNPRTATREQTYTVKKQRAAFINASTLVDDARKAAEEARANAPEKPQYVSL